MFNRAFVLMALVAVPCLGVYNPKDVFFEFAVMQGKGHFSESPEVVTSIETVMRNVPLYFASANDVRDYVKNFSFTVEKDTGGKYNLKYKILSSYISEDMVLKNVQKEMIEAALKDSFPNLQDTTLEAFLTTFSAPSGRIIYTGKSLYELKESERNKAQFLNSMKFVNHFIPKNKLHFDENDLLVPETKSSWFSLKAWRDWLFSK